MNKKIKVGGTLGFFLRWPLFVTILMALLSASAFFFNKTIAVIFGIVTVLYFATTLYMYIVSRKSLCNSMEEFAHKYDYAQEKLLEEASVPYVLLYEDGCISWMNKEFVKMTRGIPKRGEQFTDYFTDITVDIFPDNEGQLVERHIAYDDREYRMSFQKVCFDDLDNALTEQGMRGRSFIGVYAYDETVLNNALRQKDDESMIAGIICIDNYDEVMESVEEVRQSLLVALIDRKVSQYMVRVDGIAKKLEHDKYFIIFKRKYFDELKNDRFSLLSDVKTLNVKNNIAPTLSIGIGADGKNYSKNYDYARMALDLALGRGGDQAVVKEKDRILYYGGKSEQTQAGTRVKARVKADALRELAAASGQIIVMGHRITDADCFGAAVGIWRIAHTLGKRCSIVLDDLTLTVRPLLEVMKEGKSFDREMFVSNEKALRMMDDNTMLIVVDTNRPSYTQCPELLDRAKRIVVIDHHRQMTEAIGRTMLSYIEPSASSACEMVAEIMQYISENLKLEKNEASCMYAGIIIDTNNFTTKTGVRTFDAASYLRRCGADIVRVRKMFRDDFRSYQAKAETIRNTEVYRNSFAIARFPDIEIDSPTVIGSQVANELLNINGIKASFVLTEYKDSIFVSARSIDEINVQIIMENMGGGGHMSTAGCQLPHTTIDNAVRKLKATIDVMLEKGEI